MLTLDPARPFVLLDDARDGGSGQLFRDPSAVLTALKGAAVRPLLAKVQSHAGEGSVLAGMLSYEAGEALAGDTVGRCSVGATFGWFGVFKGPNTVADVAAILPDPCSGAVVDQVEGWTFARYAHAFETVAAAITAGSLYQVNLSVPGEVSVRGDPLGVYARLRGATGAPHCAIVWTGERLILSFSPELFVEREGDRLRARPMKGTAPRGRTPAADRSAAVSLASDPKQRAENRMIVDLVRNDLARIANPGSVTVARQFTVERYANVWQMTSTVSANARPDLGVTELMEALFPCGSVTGAPKRAAREMIIEVESGPRDTFCGTIGRLGPGTDARLSVAIRTMSMTPAVPGDVTRATLRLGSGVVADSTAAGEWAECRLKGRFVAAARPAFDLIETMIVHPDTGIERLEGHLARMTRSAAALGFDFDRHAARNELQVATFGLAEPARLRLLLARSGALAIELSPAPRPAPEEMTFDLVPISLSERDVRRWHKTTDRAHYDGPRGRSRADEVVFVDEHGLVTEGSFTSVFLKQGDVLLTPSSRQALIPGVLRDSLLADGRAVEAELRSGDLVGEVWLGNSARGLMKARQRTGPETFRSHLPSSDIGVDKD